MKIAVLSDIHGNVPALQTAVADIEAWHPDKVVVNGDVVNRGPRSDDCLALVLEKHKSEGWHLLRGNHEEFVVSCAKPDAATTGPQHEINLFAHWALNQIGQTCAMAFENWAEVFSWTAPDGSEFRVTHASMGNNRRGIFRRMKDAEIRKLIAPPPAVFVTSHTHEPLIRRVDETQVVNIGAVGSPFDGDRRLSYGRFTWTTHSGWTSEVRRLDYDFDKIERDYVESGFLAEAGPFTQLMLVELRRAGGLFFRWAKRYHQQTLAGEVALEASVREILLDEDLRPFLGRPGWELDELTQR